MPETKHFVHRVHGTKWTETSQTKNKTGKLLPTDKEAGGKSPAIYGEKK